MYNRRKLFDFRQAHGGFQHTGFSFFFFLFSDATTTIRFEALKKTELQESKTMLNKKKPHG
jgi:hypothetical protein